MQTIPVAAADTPSLSPDAFLASATSQRRDTQTAQLLELTEPEMAVLIAARHLQLRDKEPFTLEMCFHELRQFVQRVQRDLTSASTQNKHSVVMVGLEALAAREPILQAFTTLLALELLVPEPARLSLALPAGAATRTGPATNAYGTLPSATVIPEFLPVSTAVSGRAILAAATDPRRTEALSSVLVKWAESTGV